MSGDTTNVSLWPNADVLIGAVTSDSPDPGEPFALTGTDPWAFAGILDGDAGFAEDQANDNNKFFGWGVGTIAVANRNLSITRTFTALEDNEETLGLRYDVSGITFTSGAYSGDLGGRDLQRQFRLAMQMQKAGKLKRFITKNYAQINSLGTVTEGENNLFSLPVTVEIFPTLVVDGDTGEVTPVYWETYLGPVVVPGP